MSTRDDNDDTLNKDIKIVYSFLNDAGVASVAKAFTDILDAMCNNAISEFFIRWVPMHSAGLSEYVDFVSFGLTIVFTRKRVAHD